MRHMARLTLQCCFRTFFAGATSALLTSATSALLLTGCTRIAPLELERISLPDVAPLRHHIDFSQQNYAPLLGELYPASQGITACQMVDRLRLGTESLPDTMALRFRFFESLSTHSQYQNNFLLSKGLYSNIRQMPQLVDRVRFLLSQGRRDLAIHEISIDLVKGKIDIAANPLFQYGITEELRLQGVLTEGDFHRAFKNELPWKDVTFLAVSTLRNVFEIFYDDLSVDTRNRIYRSELSKKFPGAFEKEGEEELIYPVGTKECWDHGTCHKDRYTVPFSILANSAPGLSQLIVRESDTDEAILAKAELLQSVIEMATSRLALFVDLSWATWGEDFRMSLATGLRGLESSAPQEQLCGGILLNRSFAQMLTFKGYNKPIMFDDPRAGSSRFPKFEDMLVGKRSNIIRVCPNPGSFARAGNNAIITATELGDSFSAVAFKLTKEIFPGVGCPDKDKAISVLALDEFAGIPSGETGTVSEWIEFLSGMGTYVSALNPGAKWRQKRPLDAINFPHESYLGDIMTFRTRSVLPPQSYALAFGFINIGVNNLVDHHLVQLNKDGKDTFVPSEVVAIRISRDRYRPGRTEHVLTSARDAALLAISAFRISGSVDDLANWYLGQKPHFDRFDDRSDYGALIARTQRKAFPTLNLWGGFEQIDDVLWNRAENLEAAIVELAASGVDPTFRDRVKTMDRASKLKEVKALLDRIATLKRLTEGERVFKSMLGGQQGAESTLDLLLEGGPQSIREQLKDLQVVSILLLTQFAKIRDDGSVTCYRWLRNDLKVGSEQKIGQCDQDSNLYRRSTESLYKEALTLSSQVYRSQILNDLAARIREK